MKEFVWIKRIPQLWEKVMGEKFKLDSLKFNFIKPVLIKRVNLANNHTATNHLNFSSSSNPGSPNLSGHSNNHFL